MHIQKVLEIIEAEDDVSFATLIDELRESRHTRETIAAARQWATEAVDALAILPEGLPKQSLVRFASRVIDRTN